MIQGVKIIPLCQIADERGKIMHMLKATDPHFAGFGEIYFSCAWPGTIKAWHIHQTMTVNNAVLSGRAKLALFDLRENSATTQSGISTKVGRNQLISPGRFAWRRRPKQQASASFFFQAHASCMARPARTS